MARTMLTRGEGIGLNGPAVRYPSLTFKSMSAAWDNLSFKKRTHSHAGRKPIMRANLKPIMRADFRGLKKCCEHYFSIDVQQWWL
jgi:hypothetical protein